MQLPRLPKQSNQGFTLIEVLLAASIFTSVMIVAVSTFTKMNQLNDKAREFRSVSESGRFAMESITRAVSGANGFDYDDETNNIHTHLQSMQICDSTGVSGTPVNPTIQSNNLTLVTVQTNSETPTKAFVSRFTYDETAKQLYIETSDNPGTKEPITDNSVTVEGFSLSGVSATTTAKVQPFVTISLTIRAVPMRPTLPGALQEFKTSTVVRDYLFQSRAVTTNCATTSS